MDTPRPSVSSNYIFEDLDYENAVTYWQKFFGEFEPVQTIKIDGKQYYMRRGGAWIPVSPLVWNGRRWVTK